MVNELLRLKYRFRRIDKAFLILLLIIGVFIVNFALIIGNYIEKERIEDALRENQRQYCLEKYDGVLKYHAKTWNMGCVTVSPDGSITYVHIFKGNENFYKSHQPGI